MKQGWTNFNRILLGISCFIGLVMVIVLTVSSANNSKYDGWVSFVIFFSGVFSVLSFHAIWGLFVEMAENIAQLSNKDYNLEIDSEKDDTNQDNSFPWKCHSCGRLNYFNPNRCANCNTQRNVNVSNNPEPVGQAELRWTCTECGSSNPLDSDVCEKCGKPPKLYK